MLLTVCTVSGLTSQTLIAPSSEAVARRLPLADHASAVTAALWLADVLELTRFLRTKSPPLSATAGAVPGRLLMCGAAASAATDTVLLLRLLQQVEALQWGLLQVAGH